jgi:hypothetical protein
MLSAGVVGAVVLGLALLLAPASPAGPESVVTVVGDSVAASLSYVASARALLGRGFTVHYNLRVCRRLVEPSCPYQGEVPPTALEAVRSYGASLGNVLVVDVGYNDSPQGYGAGIDRIMHAALAQGVSEVVWVTLREVGGYAQEYRSTNAAIGAATKRWPELEVADWNAYSAGKPWFAAGGLHLSPTGATMLASFLRPFITRG